MIQLPQSGRHFLQIPRPTNVPDQILRAIERPTIDHRGPEFKGLGLEVLEVIKEISQTKQPVIIYPSSGTGAWEAALVNTLSPGRLGADVRYRALRLHMTILLMLNSITLTTVRLKGNKLIG